MSEEPKVPSWLPPAPRELPALREHLVDYLSSLPAHLFTTELLRQGRGTLRPVTDPASGARLLLEDERRRLSESQLFYVTADITKLVRHAAQSLRDRWDIQPHDLPALPWGANKTALSESNSGRAIEHETVAATKTTIDWLRTVHAGWLFCQPNTLTETTDEHLPRTQRRRAERAGHNASPIRVVSISRRTTPAATKSEEPSGRTVSVRFPVAPYFRRQPYGPGRTLRRWTPVAGHWRGPVDAPVRIGTKVTLVDTHPPIRRTDEGEARVWLGVGARDEHLANIVGCFDPKWPA